MNENIKKININTIFIELESFRESLYNLQNKKKNLDNYKKILNNLKF